MLVTLLIFSRPILLLDPHGLHSSFADVFDFKKLQLFLDALIKTSNVLQENWMIINGDSKRNCLLVEQDGIVLDRLIIFLMYYYHMIHQFFS